MTAKLLDKFKPHIIVKHCLLRHQKPIALLALGAIFTSSVVVDARVAIAAGQFARLVR